MNRLLGNRMPRSVARWGEKNVSGNCYPPLSLETTFFIWHSVKSKSDMTRSPINWREYGELGQLVVFALTVLPVPFSFSIYTKRKTRNSLKMMVRLWHLKTAQYICQSYKQELFQWNVITYKIYCFINK